MIFTPRGNKILGRTIIAKLESLIIRPDKTVVSKFVLVDAVGKTAEAAGIKAGDIIVPTKLGAIVIHDSRRASLEEEDVWGHASASLEDFLVQTDDGKDFVPFEDPKAAKPLAAQLAPAGEVDEKAA